MAGCTNHAENVSTEMEQTGILGTWELEKIFRNGIADLSAESSTFITFEDDDQPDDLSGIFTSQSIGSETTGKFILYPDNGTIQFEYNDAIKLYEYHIQDDFLRFTYQKNDLNIEENWRKK